MFIYGTTMMHHIGVVWFIETGKDDQQKLAVFFHLFINLSILSLSILSVSVYESTSTSFCIYIYLYLSGYLYRSSVLMHNDPITLHVALDKNGEAEGTLYIDDGQSFEYREVRNYCMCYFPRTISVLYYCVFEGCVLRCPQK